MLDKVQAAVGSSVPPKTIGTSVLSSTWTYDSGLPRLDATILEAAFRESTAAPCSSRSVPIRPGGHRGTSGAPGPLE